MAHAVEGDGRISNCGAFGVWQFDDLFSFLAVLFEICITTVSRFVLAQHAQTGRIER